MAGGKAVEVHVVRKRTKEPGCEEGGRFMYPGFQNALILHHNNQQISSGAFIAALTGAWGTVWVD